MRVPQLSHEARLERLLRFEKGATQADLSTGFFQLSLSEQNREF
jgi:hypothetical protein